MGCRGCGGPTEEPEPEMSEEVRRSLELVGLDPDDLPPGTTVVGMDGEILHEERAQGS